ncbi:hypothetical protein GCM10009802_61620 [Streptomyces synnematoformans]|uniref:Uncharacterized protein n=1 Tax=Streptomyces synnematoformans TaxID=415721 RepID=A0ABN1ZV96_9ACTN
MGGGEPGRGPSGTGAAGSGVSETGGPESGVSGTGVYGIDVAASGFFGAGGAGGGAVVGGTPRSRAAVRRAHRVAVYGSRAYRAGRRAAAVRDSASAGDSVAAAAGAAYDALYQRCAADVTRHTYLLTGDHALTREAVEHAFHIAWERWPEVASDRDPPGWLRAAAFAYVQAPWEWLRARLRARRRPGRGRRARPEGERGREPDGDRHREPDADEPCGEPADRRLFAALLALPESYRSAVVVYDVVGLDLPEAAAELEATTMAAAGRLTHAHEALAAAVPELGQLPPPERAEALRTRLRQFAAAQPVRTLPPGAARHRSERRTDRQLRRYGMLAAAVFLTAAAVTAFGGDHIHDKATPPTPPWPTLSPAPDHIAPAPPAAGAPPAPIRPPPTAPR